VPSCEFYPIEAVKTNIIGPENVLRAAIKNSISKAVFLSTDKAVYPINAMGLSKAMMEKLVVSKARNKSSNAAICCTRYGNVMASRGSVIPLFVNQIKSDNPITITDPDMTRFMMSLDESVELVEYAFNTANPGDIFVKKAPAATIHVLAKALLKIFDKNNPIEIIGTRHGEKLYETLLTREEMQKAEDLGDYYKVPPDNRDLNYSGYFTQGNEIKFSLDEYNSHNTERLDEDKLIELLLKLDYIKRELRDNEED
jgi:UDP-glucose 4-epimerase